MANRGCSIGLNSAAATPASLRLALLPCVHGASNRMRVISSGGGSTSAARSMNATAAAESRASSAHAGQSARWRSTSAFSAARQRAVHVIADQNFELRAVHTASFCFRSSRASSARPRLIRDFTVPSGICSTSAISRYSISCKSRKITASRKSGESFCRVACRISLASRPATAWSGRAERRRPGFLEHRKLLFDRIRNPLLTCSAIMIDQKVTRHPRQPGAETSLPPTGNVLQRAEHPQENFLRQILRFRAAVR